MFPKNSKSLGKNQIFISILQNQNRRKLNRTDKCKDNFEIQKQSNGEIVLHWFHPNVTFNTNEYCLGLKDGQMFAEICKDEHENRQRFK